VRSLDHRGLECLRGSAGMSTVIECFLFAEDWLGSSLGLDMRACNSFVNGGDLQILSRLSLNALFG